MNQLKRPIFSRRIFVLGITSEQICEFARRIGAPIDGTVIDLHHSTGRGRGVNVSQFVLVLLPNWHKREGFRSVQIKMHWEGRGGSVMKISEEQLRGEIPIDILPLM